MAIQGSTRIDTGDRLPAFEIAKVGGGTLDLSDLGDGFTVVLVNRGSWCPYCNAQLRSFQSGLDKLSAEGIRVVSVSADTEEQSAALVEKLGLTFDVGYGVDAARASEALGAFYEPNDGPNGHPYLHSAGFVVGPDGTVLVAVTSSGAIGRLTWQDVHGMVQYVKSQG